ncbi:hypothetical protein A6F68_01367 [Tsuneonella dongtanensis]|uniref:Uncharacterized protein n=1 Tax=Tsuneonella dongtanensis TaxID=692370 RepID=A0A1B2ACP4_9SPHN|nr:hypothetical protein [Tsuneonella dongtanensis]ANY19884.1 hypothetical protein A6F68_01367 [Tsuneonella dongtanensis]
MSDLKQRPDAAPKEQSGEEKGPIKGPQRTDDVTQVKDTARGSGPATRAASGHRG